MKSRLLRSAGDSALLIFFTGWSMDDRPAEMLPRPDGLALCFCWDYTDWSGVPDWRTLAAPFRSVTLAAWSLGVFAAARLPGGLPIRLDDAAALNGTLTPVDAACGIAPEVFDGTIANWPDERSRLNFYRRVAGRMPERLPERLPAEQRRELERLRKLAAAPGGGNPFRRAVIGRRDRIFPAAAQRCAWARRPEVAVTELDLPHDLWSHCGDWGEVARLGRNADQ